jgi:hypothetical protein
MNLSPRLDEYRGGRCRRVAGWQRSQREHHEPPGAVFSRTGLSVKLVTWNCLSGRPYDKAEVLAPLEADVIVLQECARPDALGSETCLWAGFMNHKGLAVISKPPYRLCAGPVESDGTGSFLPCIVSVPVQFNLLAVWPIPGRAIWPRCMPRSTGTEPGFMNARPSSLVTSTATRSGTGRAADTPTTGWSNDYATSSLVSAWHAAHPDAPEPATLYQRYLGGYRPFHIDYCFILETWTSKLRDVTIGSFEDYDGHSDHRPLMIDVEL